MSTRTLATHIFARQYKKMNETLISFNYLIQKPQAYKIRETPEKTEIQPQATS